MLACGTPVSRGTAVTGCSRARDPLSRTACQSVPVTGLRFVGAAVLLVVGFYWVIGACYEVVMARKPPGLFGASLLRPMKPEPVLTATQWRQGGAFLLAMAGALVLLAIRLLQG